MLLKDKVAVVTGGTRGIGYAIVKAFLDEGAKVVLFGSRQETAEKAKDALKKENKDYPVSCAWPDLSNLDEVSKCFLTIKNEIGPVDILVNNAGVSDTTPLKDYTAEKFEEIMELNLHGVFNTIRAVSDDMATRGTGSIINMSSMVSKYGQPSGVAYPVSKFAVNGLTLSLARELGPKGVRVNAIAPGVTNTDMVKALPKEMIDPLIKSIPLRRIGEPEDIANAAVFLASDKASYISGAVLPVDGLARS